MINNKQIFYVALLSILHFTSYAWSDSIMLIDFKKPLPNTKIITDATARTAGLSNAALSFQSSHNNISHIFYAHLTPQPNGACFAGFRIEQPTDLQKKTKITLDLENLADRKAVYQLVLHTPENIEKGFDYIQPFTIDALQRSHISLRLDNFVANFRGDEYPDAPLLDLSKINALGLRIIGRVSMSNHQQGLYALRLFELKSQ